MKIRNSSGPSIDPCGTLHFIIPGFERTPFINHFWLLYRYWSKLFASDCSPLLKIGATLALFRSSGKIPLIKDLLKIIERDLDIPATPLITLHGILSRPDAFLEGISLIAAAT
jgi:hypothetical protein